MNGKVKKMMAPAIVLAIAFIAFIACEDPVYLGASRDGFAAAPGNTITPARSLEPAKPWLDECYELRRRSRHSEMRSPPTDIIVQKGDWYYVTRDNYPYKTLGAYTHTAVRVHVRTGEVVARCTDD